MKDINEFTGSNMGGLLRFKFIPITDVASIGYPVNHILETPVVLKTNKCWFNAYATLGTIGYTEKGKATKSGEQYACKLDAVCPKDSAENADVFMLMRHQQFLIDYTDSNGKRKLLGSLDEPFSFTSQLNTQKDGKGRNQHNISFHSKTSHKAYFYDF